MYDMANIIDIAVKVETSQLVITELLQDKKSKVPTKISWWWKLHFSKVVSLPKKVVLQEKIFD